MHFKHCIDYSDPTMKTNTLQIRAFPYDINKALKIQAVKLGLSFREHVIAILATQAKAKTSD